jgi:tRNA (guanine-N7-)-methyltransferase
MELNQKTMHVYGRRKGRPLRVRKAGLMKTLLPQLQVRLPEAGKLSLRELFQNDAPVWLEIGFGGGEHLAMQAKQNAGVNLIGCEPFINGVASLMDHLDRDQTQNVRVFNDDARMLLDALPDASLEKTFVLFADPWPKKRHTERRFIGPENLVRLARVLKPGALLRIASDHPSLIEHMKEALAGDKDFTQIYASEVPPTDWVQTRYQEKAIKAGRVPFFTDYKRN